MQSTRTFGRRISKPASTVAPAAGDTHAARPREAPAAPPAVAAAERAAIEMDAAADIDRELEEWKALRKARKRSFREPWRSMSIASGILFAGAPWILPDSVATVAQLVTFGLTAAAVVAGFRSTVA